MNKNLRNIDKLFRSALDDHEERPSQNVWDNIEKGLDEQQTGNNHKRMRFKRLAVAAVLLITAGGVFALYTQYFNTPQKLAHNAAATDKARGSSSEKVHNDTPTAVIAGTVTTPAEKDPGNSQPGRALGAVKGEGGKVAANIASARSNSAVTKESWQSLHPTTLKPAAYKWNKTISAVAVRKSQPEAGAVESAQPDVRGMVRTSRGSTMLSSPQRAGIPVFSIAGFLNGPKPGNDSLLNAMINAYLAKRKQGADRNGHLTLGAFIAPGFATRDVRENDDHLPRRPGNNRDEIEEGEQKTAILSTGLLLNFQISKKWTIGSGVFDTRTTLNISRKKLYAEHDDQGRVRYRFNCTAGYSFINPQAGTSPAPGDSIYSSTSKTVTNYVSVPLAVRYTIGAGRFQLSPSAGIVANFLTGSKLVTALANTRKPEGPTPVSGLSPVYFNGLLSFTADYWVGNRASVFVDPAYSFSVTSSTTDMPVKTYPRGMGFSIGTHFRL